MSDDGTQGEDAEKHHHAHHHHRRSSNSKPDKRLIHHNHYRHGSVVSSYTAVTGQPRSPGKTTTPFKPCHPHPKEKKRIELVIKQEGGFGYVAHEEHSPQPPQAQLPQNPQAPLSAGTCAPLQLYTQPHFIPLEPIYEAPPPARRYEVYRRTEEDEKRLSYDNTRRISYDPAPEFRKREVVSEGTGTSVTLIENRGRRVSAEAGPSHVTFAEPAKIGTLTEGTGVSMMLDSATESPHKLIIIKRDEKMDGPLYYATPPEVLSEVNLSRSKVDVKEGDLCPLCHKGWYVKKFTWSGIISAIFCFPCGIYACFRMRVYVCSFCGEEPVAEYANYKEGDIEKTEGNEGSRSRLIPPQKPSNWTRENKRQFKDTDEENVEAKK